MGYFRTALLLAVLTALFGVIGFAIGGEMGMLIALAVAVLMNVFTYWNSDKVVLKMYKAIPIESHQYPNLFKMIDKLAQSANIPFPKSYIIQNDQPNAFATGRNPENGAIALTTGLLKQLDEREIAGVIAHEMAHIKNRDTMIMTMTATIAGAIGLLANFGLFFGGRNSRLGPIGAIAMAILAPMAAMLVQMAISRSREYEADRIGAEICKDPLSLASALAKISNISAKIPNYEAERNPSTAHLFISNPLHLNKVDNLFSTHPNVMNRIEKLKEMAQNISLKKPTRRSVPSSKKNKNPWE